MTCIVKANRNLKIRSITDFDENAYNSEKYLAVRKNK